MPSARRKPLIAASLPGTAAVVMLLVASGSGCVKKHQRMRWIHHRVRAPLDARRSSSPTRSRRRRPHSGLNNAPPNPAAYPPTAVPWTGQVTLDGALHGHGHVCGSAFAAGAGMAIHADDRIGNGKAGRVSTPKTACPPLARASGRRRQGRHRAPATLIAGWPQASALGPSTQVPAVRVSWPVVSSVRSTTTQEAAGTVQPALHTTSTSLRRPQGGTASCVRAAPPRSALEARPGGK